MKLAPVPVYEGRNDAWWRVRRDVVDLSTFLRCVPVSRGDAVFPKEERPPERMVEARFCKYSGYEGYRMPLSEFQRLMRTDLAPSFE